MSKLILTIGPSFSGKSTWADQIATTHPEVVVISRDSYRYAEPGDYRYIPVHNKTFREHLINMNITKDVCRSLAKGHTVIVADTNLSASTRSHWIAKARELDANVEYVVFTKILEELRNDPYKAFETPSYVHEQCKKLSSFLGETPNPFIKYNFV